MGKTSKHELDRLLARGGLSGPDRDRIFDDLCGEAACQDEGRRPLGRLALAAAAAVAVLALAFVLVWQGAGEEPAYGVKGAGAGAIIEIACRHGNRLVEGSCAPGDRMLFRVSGLKQKAYLAAYARGPDGTRIWYFPQDDGSQPALLPSESPTLANQTVLIGDEHAPGTYRVTALLLEQRAGRGEVDSATPVGKRVATIRIHPR